MEPHAVPLQEEEGTRDLPASAMRGHGGPGSGPSPGTESASALVSAFPASRPVRNKCLLFNLCSVWYFVTAARAD